MNVIINGQLETIYPAHISLKQLLSRIGALEKIISVSLNDIVIPRGEWRHRTVSESDRIDFE